MQISRLSLEKLDVAYEAYLSSLGISTSSFVLKGELLDLPALPIGQRLGIASTTKYGAAQESRRAVEQWKKRLTIPSERSRLSDRSI